ncbi:hypothetical protein NUSPORA_02219 [Nucleospora cyclopteri]
MVVKKKVLNFKTPRKVTKTPMRVKKKKNTKEILQEESSLSEITTFNRGSKSVESKIIHRNVEQKNQGELKENLINSYRVENEMLRNLKADILLYKTMLGIQIEQKENFQRWEIERESSNGQKKFCFELHEKDKSYVYKMVSINNCNAPEFMYDVIEFSKASFPLFFYKVMQSVYEVRVNST